MLKYIPKILIQLPTLFCFIAFSSLNLYWSSYPYDAWRIYEIIILILFSFYSVYLLYKNKFSLFKNKLNHQQLFFTSIIITLLAITTIFYSKIPERAISDITLYLLLANFTITSSFIIRNNKDYTQRIMASIAILPLLTLVFLPIALLSRIQGGDGVWTQSFTNIRMLDDALLPCLFLLWLQPAWLNPKEYNSIIKKILIITMLYTTSVIYLLSFLFHGARACLLAISIALIISIFVTKTIKWHLLKLPFISFFTAIILFNIYHIILPTNIGSSISRTGSSGRTELWQKAIQIWLENPILGIGGNHFSLQTPTLLPAHPHNIFFKLLAEWGSMTFIVVFIVLIIFQKIYKYRNNIPTLLISGLFAIVINSLLSGSFIYPVSQIINFYFFALILSFLPIYQITKNYSYFNYQKILWITLSILSTVAILYVHGQDIICYPCISIDKYGAPNFWDQGRAIHLSPFSDLKKSSNSK